MPRVGGTDGAILRYGLFPTLGNYEVVCGVSIYMGRILQTKFALGIVLTASAASPQPKPETPTLTICDVRSQAKKYLGKVVTVTGEVQGTGHHGVVGMSNSQCPTVGVALAESKEMGKSRAPQSDLFRDAIGKTLLCTDERVFVATVQGRFGTALTEGIPIYRIMVDRVLRAEFMQQTSPSCINREPPLPPPAIEISSKPMPDFSRQ
jgi:hypothetical protein